MQTYLSFSTGVVLHTRASERTAAAEAGKERGEHVGRAVGEKLLRRVDLVLLLLGEEIGQREIDGIGDDGGQEGAQEHVFDDEERRNARTRDAF